MIRIVLIAFLCVFSINDKNIIIDSQFKTHQTELKVTIDNKSDEILRTTICNDKLDSLRLTASNIGLGGTSLRILFT